MKELGLYLRKVETSDIDLLFKWANDPVVRENSFNTEPIPFENHVRWFNKMLADDSVLQYILMCEDTPIGQIRLNINGEEAEIGYSIANDYRGQGYGHSILRLVADTIAKEYKTVKYLTAKVKPENVASNKLFQDEGYSTQYTSYIRKIGDSRIV